MNEKPSVAAPAARYEVCVTRAGVRRCTVLAHADASHVVREAVHAGLDVSCRLLDADERARPGIWEVPS